ncbi:MAG: RNase P modulator RnpM [Candidatus Spyradocola sp.]
MRMCVGCREMKPKKELIRVVRQPSGQVMLDRTGKAAGRGAYVCPDSACLEKARKSKVLERTLEAAIEPEVYDQLAKELDARVQ